MYLLDPALNALVSQALGMYQDKAGPVKTLALAADAVSVAIPEDYLGVAVALDAEGRWHEVDIVGEDLVVTEETNSVKPYKITYFVNMREMDIEEGVLPFESITVLTDYLYVLISIPNTQRTREVAAATGMQVEIPGDADLDQRKSLLEHSMEDCQSIIPMATVY